MVMRTEVQEDKINDIIGKPFHPKDWNCYSVVTYLLDTPKIQVVHDNIYHDIKEFKRNLSLYRPLFEWCSKEEADVFYTKNHIGVIHRTSEGDYCIDVEENGYTKITPLEIIDKLPGVKYLKLNKTTTKDKDN
jgi:hypothetical protein